MYQRADDSKSSIHTWGGHQCGQFSWCVERDISLLSIYLHTPKLTTAGTGCSDLRAPRRRCPFSGCCLGVRLRRVLLPGVLRPSDAPKPQLH